MKMPSNNISSFSDKVIYLIPFVFTFGLLFIFGRPGMHADTNIWFIFFGLNLFFGCFAMALDIREVKAAKLLPRLLGILVLANLALATNLDLFNGLQDLNAAILGSLSVLGTLTLLLYWSQTDIETFKDISDKRIITLLLFAIFLIGLYLRFKNIHFFDSNRDEEHHMMAARSLLTNGYFQYERGAIVTLLTAFWAKILGADSFESYLRAGRMSMPIIGSLTIIPIYFIGKFINKRTGVIAAFLFATSPWLIGMSNVIREHTIYILLVSCFILLVVNFFKQLLGSNSSFKSLAPSIIGILAILVYAFSFDWLSTAKITGVFFVSLNASLAIVYFSRIKEIILRHRKLLLPLAAVMLLTLFFLSRIKFLDTFQFRDARWSNSFLLPSSNSPVHWWTKAIAFKYIPHFFIFCGLILSIVKKQRMFVAYLLCFSLMLFGYQYFLTRYFAPKYIIYLMPLFVVCIAYGIEAVIQLILVGFSLPRTKSLYALLFAACLFVINPVKVYQAVKYPPISESQNMVTGLIHLDKSVATNFLESIPKQELKEHGIISSVYENIVYMGYDWECVHQYKYKSSGRTDFVAERASQYDKGYMILDSYRNGLWKPGFSNKMDIPFKIGETNFRLIEHKNNCMIYEWGDHVRSPDELYEKINEDYRLETNYIVDLGKPMSISFWIYDTNEEKIADPFNILSVGEDSAQGFVLNFASTDTIETNLDYGTFEEKAILRTPFLRDGDWHHMVIYQSGGVKGSLFGCYVDGRRATPSRVPVHKFGKQRLFINSEFDGDIQEVKTFEKMLTADEVVKLYEASKKRFKVNE